MILRLAFSISLMSPHEIMLIDEIIGVGDASFIGKARARLEGTFARSGIVVVASHAIDLIEGMCNKAIYLREGRMIEFGRFPMSSRRSDVKSPPHLIECPNTKPEAF